MEIMKMNGDILRLENISFSYPKKKKNDAEISVFSNMSLNIKNSSFIGVMGENGSGKSTLLKLISGLVYPDAGRIYLNETDITNMTVQSRNIGYVFQSPVLYPHLTIYQNIRMGLNGYMLNEDDKDIRIKKILSQIKLLKKANYKPRHLSQGEKERVSIAKAIVREPELMLLDEPFSSLDSENKKKMLELLLQLKDEYKTTIIMASNQFNDVSNADKIILLKNGKVYFDGAPIDMVRSNDVYVKQFIF